MKIVHVILSDKISGAERVVQGISKKLKRHNFVEIVCCEGDISESYRKYASNTYMLNCRNPILMIGQLISYLRRVKPDIVHAHDNRASLYVLLAMKLSGIRTPIVSHVHNSYPFLLSSSLEKLVDSSIRKYYDANIMCTELVDRFYRNNAPYYKKMKNVIILNNFTDVKSNITLSNTDEYEDIYELRSLKENNTLVGFVGRLEPQKALYEFILELENINKSKLEGIKIIIIGSGSQDGLIRKTIDRLALKKNIVFLGYKKNIYPYLKLLDIMILPSKYEGLPISVLEAMSLKVPVIASNVGGISSIIRDGQTGLLVPKRDYILFLQKILWLKENRKEALRIALNAYKLVCDEYDIESYIKNLTSLYTTLISVNK